MLNVYKLRETDTVIYPTQIGDTGKEYVLTKMVLIQVTNVRHGIPRKIHRGSAYLLQTIIS